MSIGEDVLRKDVQKVINRQKIDERAKLILNELALDFDGFEQGAAASILAAATQQDASDIAQTLLAIVGSGLVRTVKVDGHARLVANFDKLGFSEVLQKRIKASRPSPFSVLDAPHAPAAMSSLHQLFVDETGPIYVGLEMTAHTVFKNLEQRARAGRMTTFIMPKRHVIPENRRAHYDDILQGWIRFISGLPARSRESIRLRLTGFPYRYLYTSTLTPSLARFDCYWYDQGTTRRGTMVVATSGSSLYDLVHREYAGVMDRSTPVVKLWPLEWVGTKLQRYRPIAITAVILAVATAVQVSFDQFKAANYVVAFLLGLAGEATWMHIEQRVRVKRGLFDA